MPIIRKHKLVCMDGLHNLNVHAGCKVVGLSEEDNGLCLWTYEKSEVMTLMPLYRTFALFCGVGNINHLKEFKHIGMVFVNGQAWHVFEGD